MIRYLCIFCVVGLFGLFGLGCQAQAVICKTTDKNGDVTYSELPETACQEPVAIRRIPPNYRSPVQPEPPLATPQPVDKPVAVPFQGYQQFSIQQPKPQGVVRNNSGEVPVRFHLQPALQPGHRIQLVLDGLPVMPTVTDTSAMLSRVERGRHALTAQILDGSGKAIKTTQQTTHFVLHKFSALNAPK